MPDRPHIIIPGDVTSSFATSEGLTGDAARLAALMRTARSRLVIGLFRVECGRRHLGLLR